MRIWRYWLGRVMARDWCVRLLEAGMSSTKLRELLVPGRAVMLRLVKSAFEIPVGCQNQHNTNECVGKVYLCHLDGSVT